ncbi:hypothetical protein RBU49_10305 [Clostridium sp. MB40-C1]|uniref:hypothetical protein n=1 Tax=Clostridium sp. MB40-C1 TaxID=3070996 RepID=UPI0027E12C3E|nr:hypothetical protein [Clostridium sp. MB40-C1]WMJ79281.1 hypothetical protein RBU49_10305 [Clostridium sp. MB40-C1]
MGYLLLQDGSLFQGKIIGEEKNLLGEMLLKDENSITIQCPTTHNEGSVINNSNNITDYIKLSDTDFQCLKQKIKNNNVVIGKIVIDTLPIDFHLYDLKTCVTLGLN